MRRGEQAACGPFAKKRKGGIATAATYRKKYNEAVLQHFSQMRRNEKGAIVGAPSFVSFAEEIGVTLPILERWRESNPDFDRACEHATELLRQLLIDASLSEEVNVSAAKFILGSEFGMGAGKAGRPLGGQREADTLSDEDRRLLENLSERLFGEKDTVG